MKIFKSLALLLFVGVLFSFTQSEKTNLHTEQIITWKGKKVTGSHEGTINLKSGGLDYNKGVPTGGSFVIDMTSIAVTDLKAGGAKKLRGHLMSPDFFDVASHPEAKFMITNISRAENLDGAYNVEGDLTIKGITKGLQFRTDVTKEDGHMIARATINVDRTLYNIKYGSGKFFDSLGDKMIDDNFELNVTLVK
jgi:polyisoprenoid-binding protein YceI